MKYSPKKLIMALALVLLLSLVGLGVFAAEAVSDDPAASYEKQTAPYEDESLSLWFEHSFNKVLTKDTEASDMDTYSVYMAKNEIENAQFVLYSDTDKTGMRASISEFTNANGDTLSAEIYYQMYITTSNLHSDSVRGMTMEDSIIREGETPDPIAPLKNVGAFKLNGGKSQAFYIRLKSSENTPSGWYCAQLDVMNSSGQVVKTATVFAYVWDFVIDEKTEFQTSIYFDNKAGFGGSYQTNYDYLLENRIVGMYVPGSLNSSNPYLTKDRVNTVCVGVSGGYMDGQSNYGSYAEVYSDLSSSDVWDEIKDKFYFYTVDEPMSQEQQDAVVAAGGVNSRHTLTDVILRDELLDKYWGDIAQTCVPYHQNHPYPYYHYDQPLSNYALEDKTDATQVMIDTDSCRVWCPLLTAFTPKEELDPDYATNYTSRRNVRTITAQISGMYAVKNPASPLGYDYYGGFYDWDSIYGEFYDRTMSDIIIKNEKYDTNAYKMWTYLAGCNNQYTYAHHLIESTGIQTKMLFWQCYQQDITGYLYYYANEWDGTEVDGTDTGALTMLEWTPGITTYDGKYNIYGAGVLFYGPNHAKGIRGLKYVGTVRIELMRDGIEEYQMLKMLEDYIGEKETKDVVGKVSSNVVRYLSLPSFDRSAWDSSMDDYDIMAAVRLELGNTLEAAVRSGHCEHSFDGGEEILAPTCLEMGTLRRTCTRCGVTTDEWIPTLHAEGSCYVEVDRDEATCTEDGRYVLECTVCANRKSVTVKAYHTDRESYVYEQNSQKTHLIYCSACNDKISTEEHVSFTKDTATCTEGGQLVNECQYCMYTSYPTDGNGNAVITDTEPKGHRLVTKTTEPTCTEDGQSGIACDRCDYSETQIIPAAGHSYADGACEICGAADPDYEEPVDIIIGDLDGDGKVNAKDSNILKRLVSGAIDPTPEQKVAGDINGDKAVNAIDANLITRLAAGT